MVNDHLPNEDLLKLFSDLIGDTVEREIFNIIFSGRDEEDVFEELIKQLENHNDQD